MTDTKPTDTERRTEHDRILRGAAVVALTLFGAAATTPFIDTLPAPAVQMLQLTVTVGIAYGGQLIATSEPAWERICSVFDALGVPKQ
jgi:hypothetical protein